MKGIEAAFTGYVTKDAERRTTRDGKPWARVTLAVPQGGKGDSKATDYVGVSYFGEDVDKIIHHLRKGCEVYARGRLSLDTWTGRDGEERKGLSMLAWDVVPIGVRHRPTRTSKGRGGQPERPTYEKRQGAAQHHGAWGDLGTGDGNAAFPF